MYDNEATTMKNNTHDSGADMEQHLLADPTISQARVVNLAASGEEARWAVAIALASPDDGEGPRKLAVLKGVRKALRKKIEEAGDGNPVPKRWFVFSNLPIDVSGRVDDAQLAGVMKENENDRSAGGAGASTQEIVTRAVSKVLNLPLVDVSPAKSFIRLGGDSITAIQVMAQCYAANLQLRVRDIMKCESLVELSSLATATVNDNAGSTGNGITHEEDFSASALRAEALKYWGVSFEQVSEPQNTVSQKFDITGSDAERLLQVCNSSSRIALEEVCIAATQESFRRVFADRNSLVVSVDSHSAASRWHAEVELSPPVDGDLKTAVCLTKDTIAKARSAGPKSKSAIQLAELHLTIVDERQHVGHANSHANGSHNGHANGQSNGKSNGHSDGPSNGHPNGNSNGHTNGHSSGISYGHSNGHAIETAKISELPMIKRNIIISLEVRVVSKGQISVALDYPLAINRHDDILEWLRLYIETLKTSNRLLTQSTPLYSLSDFPQLPLSYSELDRFVHATSELGFDNIESAYPTSPVQDGILISQIRFPTLYRIDCIFEIHRHDTPTPLSRDALEDAWRQVVARHTALRTVFVSSPRDGAVFDQVVLKSINPQIERLESAKNASLASAALRARDPVAFSLSQPNHRLMVCSTADGRVYCRLEISHAIVDGMSGDVLFNDLCLAYGGLIPHTMRSTFGDYMSFVQSQPKAGAITHWLDLLGGAQPCYFPSLVDQAAGQAEMKRVPIYCGSSQLKSFCMAHGITVAVLVHAVWGVVLRGYTLSDDVSFGYLTSGRDASMAGIDRMIGPLINLLVCRITFDKLATFKDLLLDLQSQLGSAMEHQHVSLAEIQHSVVPGQRQLFNTLVSMMYTNPEQPGTRAEVGIRNLVNHAPTEVGHFPLPCLGSGY